MRNASEINDVLQQPVTLRVRIRQPNAGKPSYTIIGYDRHENDGRGKSPLMTLG